MWPSQASGIQISDEVVKGFQEIRTRHQGSDPNERYKLLVFRVSDDEKFIIVDQEVSLKMKDLKDSEDIFKSIVNVFPTNECRYALYDCTYENKESVKEDLVFIMWAPETAPLKSKMVYASSKGSLRSKLQGLKIEWQVNDLSDIKDTSAFLEKLGGRQSIKSLEGKTL
ncbi:non-muscle cofilin 1-like [Chanos chanos]|uniref:Non-muscle cofilin 1-like n=1 Tax=Chanos chanos TaxID=29144 RepID=A0A6J2V5D7_CHACN|nr:cofilin-2-like [Chanos chanos]